MIQRMEIRDKKGKIKVTGAFLLSVWIHLFIILLVAIILTRQPAPPPPAKPEAIELTLLPPIDMTPAPDPYIETTESQRSETPPDQKTFESDKDTRAASEQPAVNDLPIPSQAGRDDPGLQFENRSHTAGPKPLDTQAAPPSQLAKPVPARQPVSPPVDPKVAQTEPKTTPTPAPDELALLQPQPKKEPQPEKPETPRPMAPAPPPQPRAYRPETRTTRIQGGISNRGRSAVNAIATPMGRYKKMLSDAIGSRWYYYVRNDMGLLSIGTVVIRFVVRPDGKVENVQVISNSSNETFATTSIRSIIEAEIPPIPPEVASVIDGGKLEVDYTFTIMNN